MSKNILILPGDGIGPEIVAEAVKVLATLRDDFGLDVDMDEALVGGAAIDATGGPLPEITLNMAREADAVLLGAVGGPKWETLPRRSSPSGGRCCPCANTSTCFATYDRPRFFPPWPGPAPFIQKSSGMASTSCVSGN